MSVRSGYVVIDSADPERLAAFWGSLLGVGVDAAVGDGEYLLLAPTTDGLSLTFQRVRDTKSCKNRVHLDLFAHDLDDETAEVEKLGGHWLEPGTTHELEDFRWRCMADPEATSSTSCWQWSSSERPASLQPQCRRGQRVGIT
jgi:hypothetical protein